MLTICSAPGEEVTRRVEVKEKKGRWTLSKVRAGQFGARQHLAALTLCSARDSLAHNASTHMLQLDCTYPISYTIR